MILDIDFPILIDTTGISDSDHKILSTTWHTNFTPTTPHCKRKKRKIFLYNRTTEDNWTDFTEAINISLANPPSAITPENLNKYWYIWSNQIKSAANLHILFTFKAPKTFNALSLKTTKLHSALTHINKAIRLISVTPTTSTSTINHYLSIVTKATEISINPVTTEDISINKQQTLSQLKEYKTII